MLNYILVLCADIGYTLGFSAQKIYEKKEGNTIASGLGYNMLMGAVSTVIMFFLCGFQPQYSPFSLVIAFLQTLLLSGYTLIGFYILKKGSMSLYTLFLMSGGMIVPYVWGVAFLGEELTVLRTVGVAVITFAVVLTNLGKNKISKSVLILCVLVFFINGFTGVLAKIHQIEAVYKIIPETSLMFWSALFKFIVCAIGCFALRGNSGTTGKINIRHALIVTIFAAVSTNSAEFINLLSAAKLPASVLYPLITGGTIILSAIAGRVFFKEKLSGKQITAIVLCLAGTCMFL